MNYIPSSFRNLPQDPGENPVPPSELPNNFSGFAIAQFTFNLMIHCTCPPKLWWSSYFKVILYFLFKDE